MFDDWYFAGRCARGWALIYVSRVKINKQSICDPTKVFKFRLAMHELQDTFSSTAISSPSQLDDALDYVNNIVRIESLRVFGKAKAQPRQPWMSNQTFELVRLSAIFRRKMHASRMHGKLFLLCHFVILGRGISMAHGPRNTVYKKT